MSFRSSLLACTVLIVATAAGCHAGDDRGWDAWESWAGPSGDRRKATKEPLANEFPEWGPKRAWKQELGGGYAGLLYRDGRLFTAHRDERTEVVVALSAADGTTIWEHRRAPERYDDMTEQFGAGPNATPLLLGDRLFAATIDGVLLCLAPSDGELLWQLDLHERYGRQKRQEEYGYSAPPMAYDGKLLIAVGGDQHAIVALDPANGEQLWGSPAERVSYAAPVLIEVEGQDQYVFFSPTAVIGMNPKDGSFLWSYPVKSWTENNLTPALSSRGSLPVGRRAARRRDPGAAAADARLVSSEVEVRVGDATT